MFTARELFDRSDWEYCKHYTDKRENWTRQKFPAPKIEIRVEGRRKFPFVPGGVGDWDGVSYGCYVNEQHRLPNDWGGFGGPITDEHWLDSYENFLNYLEHRLCRNIPGYSDDGYQMTLF